MAIGYIKLYRQLQDCWIWIDEEEPERFTRGQAWIDLLLFANHKDKKIRFNNGFKIIKRGQYLTSKRKLAERWRWNRRTVDKFLSLLELDEMITTECTTTHTLITIVNYEVYQGDGAQSAPPSAPQSAPQYAPQYAPRSSTNNNIKNVNNDKEESIGAKAKRFTPPTLEEVKAYCEERNNGIDPQRFIDYYSANGWVQGKGKPIKDWKACIRTWERYSKKEEPNESDKAKKRHSKYEELEKYYLGEV